MSVVYVDFLFTAISRNPQARRVGQLNGHRWCHLWSEDMDALHGLAARAGLKRKYFQDRPGFPHYDLTPGRRALAVKAGAVERHLIDWKREKLRVEAPERFASVAKLTASLNPQRESAGLKPMDPKNLFDVLQQCELELFLSGAT